MDQFVPKIENLDQFLHELNYVKLAAEVVIYKDKVGEEGLFIGDNKAKTHVVECAYSIAASRGKPKLVTTPGSDFSFLCSLIYELATGVPDASLAGAINRFSRSTSRIQLDSDEAELRWENSDEFKQAREADNFAAVAERIERLSQQLKFWKGALESDGWDEFAKLQLALRVFDVLEQIEAARNEYGPHLVWASQVSEQDHEQRRGEEEEADERLLRTEIELGRLRRERRRN